MKEAFRSSRQILDLAFNVALDPLDLHRVKNPGMRQFMKSNELAKAELLRRPAEAADGLYHVEYTERSGAIPTILAFPSESAEADGVAREIRRLVCEECVRPADILVAVPTRPERMEKSLKVIGVKALAIGGKRGAPTSNFPVGDIDFVRVTTIYSAKGHESPVVFFSGAGQLDKIEEILELKGRGPDDIERTRRSLFYVAATRAMARQYITGLETSRFVSVARTYAEVLAGRATP
jgi:superfamily I DNA/RNA helicase